MNRRDILIGGGAVVAVGAAATLATVNGMGSSSDYRADAMALRTPVADPVRDIVRHATLAPNGHNTQPWKFRVVGTQRIDILPDWSRRTPVVDPDDHHLFVSLGCAAANQDVASVHGGSSRAGKRQSRVNEPPRRKSHGEGRPDTGGAPGTGDAAAGWGSNIRLKEHASWSRRCGTGGRSPTATRP